MTLEQLALFCLLLPFFAAVAIIALDKQPNIREAVSLATGALLFFSCWQFLEPVLAGARPYLVLLEPIPGFELSLRIEPLGLLFALLASFLWVVTTLYALGYMRAHHEKNQTRFYCWFAVAMSSVMGIAFSANMFSLFIFYEILTFATWPLVTHAGTDKAKQGGRVYLGILVGSSMAMLLVAVASTWMITGTTEFQVGGVFANTYLSQTQLFILYALFVFGIGKAALMPMHRWLPAAMVAPTPVSALLHAVAVVKAGVFTIIKVTVYLFGLETLTSTGVSHYLLPIACLSILLASLTAMRKDNLKARLAYSTISQLGYIVAGALLANVWGIIAAALHMVMHAFAKITLFFCAGAIQVAAHKSEISDMQGLGKKMPYTFGFFILASLAIIGLPPLGVMWSKWLLLSAALELQHWMLIVTLVISSLLNIVYLLPIGLRAFFPTQGANKTSKTEDDHGDAPIACLIAMGITSAGCIALFFFIDPLLVLTKAIVGVP